MSRKKSRFVLTILSVFCLTAGTYLSGDRVVMSGINRQTDIAGRPEGVLCAQVPLEGLRRADISFWFDEEQEKYYLFLPSCVEETEEIRIKAPASMEVSIDGREVKKKTVLDRIPGIYDMTVDGRKYPLEVMVSGEIPALFIAMPENSREGLHEAPYEDQLGAVLSLVDKEGRIENEGMIEGIRVRGNTSADWPKKPYQLTMKNGVDFMGMGSAFKWNLLSNWSDKSLLRNKLTYDLADQAGLAWSPQSCFVDLYINGEYQGNYQLSEKVEIGRNRINIANLEDYTRYQPDGSEIEREGGLFPNGIQYKAHDAQVTTDDITGGYLLEIERPSRIWESSSWFVTAHGQPVTVKRPKYASEAEVKYISGLWQEFEDAVYAEDGYNPGTGKHYSEYMDMDSLVKKYLVEEIVRNYDASSTSQYFYKPADWEDAKLYAGPVWDYDMSLGNPVMSPLTNQNYISSVSPYGLFAALQMDDFSLWYHLYEHEDFRNRARELYEQDFQKRLEELVKTGIDGYADGIRESALADGVRWKKNKGTDDESRRNYYQESVDLLKDFVAVREYYLTGLWLQGRESKKVYLDGGMADMYISYVEGLVGDCLDKPLEPVMEGYTFVEWLNGYTKEPYDFSKPYMGEELYFVAKYRNNEDGSELIAGE